MEDELLGGASIEWCLDLKLLQFVFYPPIGITPMLQIISAVIKDAGDNTNLTLLFANQVKV